MFSDKYIFGVAIMALSVFCFSSAEIFIKLAGEGFPLHQIVFSRVVFAFLPVGFSIYSQRQTFSLKTKRMKGHLIRSFFGITSMFAIFYAVTQIPLSIAAIFTSTAPLFVSLLSPIFLKEKITHYLWIASFLGFAGALVIIRPEGVAPLWPSLIAVLGAVLTAFAVIYVRKLGRTESAITSTFINLVVMFLVTAVMMVVLGWKVPNSYELFLLCMLGVFAGVGQLLYTHAYRFVNAAVLANIEYTAIIWGLLFGYTIWSDRIDKVTLFGFLLVLLGSVVSTVRGKRLVSKKVRITK